MPSKKPRATDDGVLYLLKKRRHEAKEAMLKIVKGFLSFPVKIPSVTLLIDYLSNMVLCLELMLKLLSDDWGSHDASEMYKKVFGTEYTKSDVLIRMEKAVKDQKYLMEPASGIADYIPELEDLFESLDEVLKDRFGTFTVEIDYELPRSVGEFIRDRAGGFYYRSLKMGETVPSVGVAFREEVGRIQENIDLILASRGNLPFGIDIISSV